MSEVRSIICTLFSSDGHSLVFITGTNTDGVLIDVERISDANRGVIAHFKAPTTPNVSDGIEEAVRQVLTTGAVSPSDVSCVSIGTTAFINAVLEADAARLSKVAVVRLCGPYTRHCPPFIDFPKRLKTMIEGHIGYIDGGFESTPMGTTVNILLMTICS